MAALDELATLVFRTKRVDANSCQVKVEATAKVALQGDLHLMLALVEHEIDYKNLYVKHPWSSAWVQSHILWDYYPKSGDSYGKAVGDLTIGQEVSLQSVVERTGKQVAENLRVVAILENRQTKEILAVKELSQHPFQDYNWDDTPDTEDPVVEIMKPKVSDTLWSGKENEIIWSASDDQLLDRVELFYSLGGVSNWISITTEATTGDGTYTWKVDSTLMSDEAQIKVVAYDAAGNSSQATCPVVIKKGGVSLLKLSNDISTSEVRYAAGILSINAETEIELVAIVDTRGRRFLTETGLGNRFCSLVDLSSGHYLLMVKTALGTQVQEIVVR